MKLKLKGNAADCAYISDQLAALRPQPRVEDDLCQKQLQLQRLQDQLDSDANGTLSLLLDRPGLECILRDVRNELTAVGLGDTTVDTVFNDVGVHDEHITFDQFESWFHDTMDQQKRAAHNAAADMHDDAVREREKTLANLERDLEELNETVTDLNRTMHGSELALHFASARTTVPMLLSVSQLKQLASWIRNTCLPLLVRSIEQSRPKLRKEAASVVAKLAVALGAEQDWLWSLDFVLPPLVRSSDSEAVASVSSVFRSLSNLPGGSQCFGHLVTQCAECLIGRGRWCRTLKGSQGTLAVVMLLHRLLHKAIGGELGAGGATALLKRCKALVGALTATMDKVHGGGQDQEIQQLAEQALEYLRKLAASRQMPSAPADSEDHLQTESMRASKYAMKTLSDSVHVDHHAARQNHRQAMKKRDMIHVNRTLLQALMHGHRKLYGHSVSNKDELFDTMDGDGSAGLSDLEFVKAMKRLDLGLSPAALERLFDELDGNHNMNLQFREFETMFRRHRRDDHTAKPSREESQRDAREATSHVRTEHDKPRQEHGSLTHRQLSHSREQFFRGTPSSARSFNRDEAPARVFEESDTQEESRLSRDQQQYLECVARQSTERKQRRHAAAAVPATSAVGDSVHDWDCEISRPVLGTADGSVLDFDAEVPDYGEPWRSSSSNKPQRYSQSSEIGIYEQERRRLGLSAETPRH